MEKYITEVIAPKLQGDGGWVEFVSLEGGELTPLVRADAEWTMPTFEPLYLQAVKKSEDGSMTVIRL
ncbi:MAG: NifU family protein [Clostridia bacterium]|nr:NifU family protein [Clostridia bacterium]